MLVCNYYLFKYYAPTDIDVYKRVSTIHVKNTKHQKELKKIKKKQ